MQSKTPQVATPTIQSTQQQQIAQLANEMKIITDKIPCTKK